MSHPDVVLLVTCAESERLTILAEECAEVIQICSKIQRFGYDDVKPGGSMTNRQKLEQELGHVTNMVNMMVRRKDITREKIAYWAKAKAVTIKQWLRFQ